MEQDKTKQPQQEERMLFVGGRRYNTLWEGIADQRDRREEERKVRAMERLAEAYERQEKQAEPECQQTPQEPQQESERQEQRKPTRGRGRPKETLKDKLIDDADGNKLQKIHILMKGKKGKDAALIIMACIKKGWMVKPTYTQVLNEFGDVGCKTGYNRYLNEQRFTKEEVEGAINSLD